MNAVQLASLEKQYGGRTVLSLEEFAIGKGEFHVILGPSGSGKTTLLYILAGLIEPSRGTVRLHGKVEKN